MGQHFVIPSLSMQARAGELFSVVDAKAQGPLMVIVVSTFTSVLMRRNHGVEPCMVAARAVGEGVGCIATNAESRSVGPTMQSYTMPESLRSISGRARMAERSGKPQNHSLN